MHKSRLGNIVIDCKTNDFDKESSFWAHALGCAAVEPSDPEDENYMVLETPPDQVNILMQKVEHPSRVHIDIETDDIDAEVQRLEKLGARRVERIRDWYVMEAPSGHRFCVVPPERSDFEDKANTWESKT